MRKPDDVILKFKLLTKSALQIGSVGFKRCRHQGGIGVRLKISSSCIMVKLGSSVFEVSPILYTYSAFQF